MSWVVTDFYGSSTNPDGDPVTGSGINNAFALALAWSGGYPSAYGLVLTAPTPGKGPQIVTNQILAGSDSSGQVFGNNQYIGGDTVDVGTGFVVGWSQVMLFGGPAGTPVAQGGRVASSAKLRQVGRTVAGVGHNRNYVAFDAGMEQLNADGDGGTDLLAGARGAYFGISPYVRTKGVNLAEATGGEVNTMVMPGSTVRYKAVWTLVGGGVDDAVQGSAYDCILGMSCQQMSVGFRDGVLIGPMNDQFPINANGTLFRTIGGSVTNGIDLSTTAFSAFALSLPGFTVDGLGRVAGTALRMPPTTPASASAPGVAGQIAWDASYIYVCTAANAWKRIPLATW